MKLKGFAIFLGVAMLSLRQAGAASSIPDDLLGTYEGGGRACYGKLVVKRRNLSWQTPFTKCQDVPFLYAKRDTGAAQIWFVLSLRPRSAKCPFKQLVVERRVLSEGEVRWGVIGFQSVADQEAERVDKALSCPLIKWRENAGIRKN